MEMPHLLRRIPALRRALPPRIASDRSAAPSRRRTPQRASDLAESAATGEFVDVGLVVRTARELAPAGPSLPGDEIARAVADLRSAAETSLDLVLGVMALEPAREDAARARAAASRVLVVDRLAWAKSTAQSLDAMLGSATGETASSLRASRTGTSLELGAALAVLSTRVLGQYDPFGTADGRLMLVAPTVVAVERALDVDPRDFRLWTALHESTHRMQFAAADWLEDHLAGLVGRLLDAGGSGLRSAGESPAEIAAALLRVAAGRETLIDAVTDPAQRELLDEVTALMSLLEGHADVVMDAVGPQIIPSLRTIRRAFDARRDAGIGPGGAVGRLLGADSKREQYRQGASFVRGVVARVGHSGLAAVFERPENLPALEEIGSPKAWVERVRP